MAVKSLMYYYVTRNEYFIQNDSKSYQLFNIYYRGIEGHILPEILTFKQATLYAPIILITILYLPPFLYVLKISFKFFGSKNWVKNFFENPVLFIFPLLTSFSFFEILGESKSKTQNIENRRIARTCYLPQEMESEAINMENRRKQRSLSVPELMISETNLEFGSGQRSLSLTTSFIEQNENTKSDTKTKENNTTSQLTPTNEPNLSLIQSNILYVLFFLGASIILFIDVLDQRFRKSAFWSRDPENLHIHPSWISDVISNVSNVTKVFISLLVVNVILWIDFNLRIVRTSSSRSNTNDVYEDLLQYSTNTLFCVIILPFIWMKNLIRFCLF